MTDLFARSQRGYAYLTEGSQFPKRGESIAFSAEFAHHPIIESIWKDYIGLVGTRIPMKLTLVLLEQLKRTLGDFREWVWIQVTANRAVHGYALDFLLDTINFIHTGRREYSLSTWESLIEKDPAIIPLDVNSRGDLFKDIVIPNTEDLLTTWLSHENGVADMFHTAHILFGKVNQ